MKPDYQIYQFEDKSLSHYAYAIVKDAEMVLIDPARNVQPYLDFANANRAQIVAIVETHPHADFVSGHAELSARTGAPILVSQLVGANYPHQPFDEGNRFYFTITVDLDFSRDKTEVSQNAAEIALRAIQTPGHSPDSICVVLCVDGEDVAVFTGDTLFIGDCGRPDLRESAGNVTADRETLARQMYHSLREKLLTLDDRVVVYPAHGAGTLCGKALSNARSSTIGAERRSNWSCAEQSEADFVATLIAEQPFVPQYFAHAVAMNKNGAPILADVLANIPRLGVLKNAEDAAQLDTQTLIIDTRAQKKFKAGHLANSVNVMSEGKFETWLGSIVAPQEAFYLCVEKKSEILEILHRVAKIGYEGQIKAIFVSEYWTQQSPKLKLEHFKKHLAEYTILDVRHANETHEKPIFAQALNIPLPQLRQHLAEIPTDRPIVVHCAAGYRSAAASSIVANALPETEVLDLSEAIVTM